MAPRCRWCLVLRCGEKKSEARTVVTTDPVTTGCACNKRLLGCNNITSRVIYFCVTRSLDCVLPGILYLCVTKCTIPGIYDTYRLYVIWIILSGSRTNFCEFFSGWFCVLVDLGFFSPGTWQSVVTGGVDGGQPRRTVWWVPCLQYTTFLSTTYFIGLWSLVLLVLVLVLLLSLAL